MFKILAKSIKLSCRVSANSKWIWPKPKNGKWQSLATAIMLPHGALIRHRRKTSYPLIFPSVEETELHQEIQLDDFTPNFHQFTPAWFLQLRGHHHE
jgi:hypothetical protein